MCPFDVITTTQGPFVLIMVGLVAVSASVVLLPSEWLSSFLQLLSIPASFRIFILFLAICHLAVALLSERFVFPIVASVIGGMLQRVRERSERRQQDAQHYRYLQQQEERHETRIDVGPIDSTFERSGNRGRHAEAAKKGGKIYKDVEEELNRSRYP